MFQEVYNMYTAADYMVFLEEDIETAPDFFEYIRHVAPLLAIDSSLYCVAGFSASGLRGLAWDENVLLRSNVQVSKKYNLKWPLLS